MLYKYFGTKRYDTKVFTQSVSLTITEGVGIRLSCTEKHESIAKVSRTMGQLPILRAASVQLGYQGFECMHLLKHA